MKNYRICISSPPDRERLVAEIFFYEIQWAEVNQEHDILEIEFYPHPDAEIWRINFSDAINALNEATEKLLEKSRQ